MEKEKGPLTPSSSDPSRPATANALSTWPTADLAAPITAPATGTGTATHIPPPTSTSPPDHDRPRARSSTLRSIGTGLLRAITSVNGPPQREAASGDDDDSATPALPVISVSGDEESASEADDIEPLIDRGWRTYLLQDISHNTFLEAQLILLTFGTGILDAMTFTSVSRSPVPSHPGPDSRRRH